LIDIAMGARIKGNNIQLMPRRLHRKMLTCERTSSAQRVRRSSGILTMTWIWNLVVGNYGKANRVYLNDGSGHYADGIDIDSGLYKTTALALGNVDSDSELELIVGTEDKGILLYNYVDAAFSPAVTIDAGPYAVTSMALANVDADLEFELVVGTKGQGILLYNKDTEGSFSRTYIESGTYQTTSLAVADVDGDSDIDVVAGNYGEADRLYRNDGSGSVWAGSAIDSKYL